MLTDQNFSEAKRQLQLLGVQDGEEVRLRAFFPKNDPRSKTDKGRKLIFKFPDLPTEEIINLQRVGYGIYFVVNPGGDKAADITAGRAIFFEHDQLALSEQLILWKKLDLPEPTLQISTGGRSIHSYWRIESLIQVDLWKSLQSDLLLFSQADRSIKDPSRVMRLAGSLYIVPDREPVLSKVVSSSGKIYSFEELREVIPNISQSKDSQNGWSTFTQSFQIPCSTQIPLEACLSRNSRELVKSGVPQGSRNDRGAALARDLIGTANYLMDIGQPFDGDPYQLFKQYCQNCQPTLDSAESENIYKSAEKSDPKPSCSPEIIENCIKSFVWRNQEKVATDVKELKNTSSVEQHEPKLAKNFWRISQAISSNLRFNELTNMVELNNESVDFSDLRLTLAMNYRISVSLNDCESIVVRLAKERSYHPVKEYLDNCFKKYGNSTELLSNLSEKILGTSELIHNTFLVKTLIGAVARIYCPGCKMDTALIFQGPQGIGKSTCFYILSLGYFDDSLGSVSDKDERLKLHRAFIVEWAELETIFRRKDVSQTKAFLSTSVDYIRPPYGRHTTPMPRRSIIVGSTNEEEFLSDTTGNRRFWIIPIRSSINISYLQENLDAIWGAATALYKSGTQWWLTESEKREAALIAKHYQMQDPWLPKIESFLRDHKLFEVTTSHILLNCLKIEFDKQSKRDQMRVAGCLKQLGWERSEARSTEDGKCRRKWVLPNHDFSS